MLTIFVSANSFFICFILLVLLVVEKNYGCTFLVPSRLTIPNSAPLVYRTKVPSRLTRHIGAAHAHNEFPSPKRSSPYPKEFGMPMKQVSGQLTQICIG